MTIKEKEKKIKDAGYIIRKYKNVFGENCFRAIGNKDNFYAGKIEYLYNLIFDGKAHGIRYTR